MNTHRRRKYSKVFMKPKRNNCTVWSDLVISHGYPQNGIHLDYIIVIASICRCSGLRVHLFLKIRNIKRDGISNTFLENVSIVKLFIQRLTIFMPIYNYVFKVKINYDHQSRYECLQFVDLEISINYAPTSINLIFKNIIT